MTPERIKALALANGFKLKTQPDGKEDLNPYVYVYSDALLEAQASDLADTQTELCKAKALVLDIYASLTAKEQSLKTLIESRTRPWFPCNLEVKGDNPKALEWLRCEIVSDMPAVHEALQNFSEDATGDNGTHVVKAVLETLDSGEASANGEAAKQSAYVATLRSALIGLVGAEDETELRGMEATMRLLPAPEADKVASINAIQALLATMPKAAT